MDQGVQMIDRPPALDPQPTAGGRAGTAAVRTDFLDYDLPAQLIAQEPCAERDQARLLVLNRARATLAHHVFHELPELLRPADLRTAQAAWHRMGVRAPPRRPWHLPAAPLGRPGAATATPRMGTAAWRYGPGHCTLPRTGRPGGGRGNDVGEGVRNGGGVRAG